MSPLNSTCKVVSTNTCDKGLEGKVAPGCPATETLALHYGVHLTWYRTLKTTSPEISDLLSLPCALHSLNSADPPLALDMRTSAWLTTPPASISFSWLHLLLCPPHLERSWPSSTLLNHILLLHRTTNLGLNKVLGKSPRTFSIMVEKAFPHQVMNSIISMTAVIQNYVSNGKLRK